MYHPLVEEEYIKRKQSGDDVWKSYFPEQWQVRMVTTSLLEHLFKDNDLQEILKRSINESSNTYTKPFGSVEKAL
jgi:hypothetical protein